MGSQGCVPKFYEDEYSEEKVQKTIKYLKAGWKLPTAMAQCSIPLVHKQKVIDRLEELGIKNYKQG